MDIDMAALRGLSARRGRRSTSSWPHDRAGPPHRLPPHRGRPAHRAGRPRPHERARGGVGRRRPTPPERGAPRVRRHAGGVRSHRRVDGPQMILQRLREAEDERACGSSRGARATSCRGLSSRASDPRMVHVDLAGRRPCSRRRSRCRARVYGTGRGCSASWSGCARSPRDPPITRSAHATQRSSSKLEVRPRGARDRRRHRGDRAIAREAGHRTKMAVRTHRAGLNAKGACIGPLGAAGTRR